MPPESFGTSIVVENPTEPQPTLDDLKAMYTKRLAVRPAAIITDPEKIERVWTHLKRENALLKWAIEEIEAMDAFIKAHHGKTHRQVDDDEIPF